MTSPGSKTGVSLMEAILASFLLSTALLMGVWLVHSSLRSLADSDRRQAATMVADNALEEMRNVLAQDFTVGLDSYNGLVRTPADYPELELTTHARLQPLLSPCTSLESSYPDAERKTLERSAWQAEAVVSWSPRAADRVVVTTLIADWREPTFEVAVTPEGPVSVGSRGTADFQASATDAFGNELPDLVFTWYVEPLDALGTVARVSRDGQLSTYQNHVRTFSGDFEVLVGGCRLIARGFYRGQVVEGEVILENQ